VITQNSKVGSQELGIRNQGDLGVLIQKSKDRDQGDLEIESCNSNREKLSFV